MLGLPSQWSTTTSGNDDMATPLDTYFRRGQLSYVAWRFWTGVVWQVTVVMPEGNMRAQASEARDRGRIWPLLKVSADIAARRATMPASASLALRAALWTICHVRSRSKICWAGGSRSNGCYTCSARARTTTTPS